MRFADRAIDPLPDDSDRAVLVGRVWNPAAGGPSVVVVRDGRVVDISRQRRHHARPLRKRRPRPRRRIRQGRRHRLARRNPRQHAAGGPRRDEAVAARADRPAGREGGRRHLRRLHAGAGDRGAGARQRRARQHDPRRDPGHDRRRPAPAEAGLGTGDGAEGASDPAGHVVAISGGRHRPRRRGVHQGAAHVGRRPPGGGRPQPGVVLEQSRAGGRARRLERRAHRRRDARQRRQPPRRRGPLRAAPRQGQGQQCERRNRPVHPPLRPRISAWTTCAAPSCG